MEEILKEILRELRTSKKITLTVPECSKLINIREDKLRELINKPGTDFPYFSNGSKFLINRDMLDKWLEKISIEHRVI